MCTRLNERDLTLVVATISDTFGAAMREMFAEMRAELDAALAQIAQLRSEMHTMVAASQDDAAAGPRLVRGLDKVA